MRLVIDIPEAMYQHYKKVWQKRRGSVPESYIAFGTPFMKEKWIPVMERMPEDGQNVLFCDIENDIMLGYHIKGRPNTHFSQDGTFDDIKNVKAWMPLPEPYKAYEEWMPQYEGKWVVESEDQNADSN